MPLSARRFCLGQWLARTVKKLTTRRRSSSLPTTTWALRSPEFPKAAWEGGTAPIPALLATPSLNALGSRRACVHAAVSKVEISPGRWRRKDRLTPRQRIAAQKILSEKARLIDEICQLLEQIEPVMTRSTGDAPWLQMPAQLRVEGFATAIRLYRTAPFALNALRDDKRRYESVLAELE